DEVSKARHSVRVSLYDSLYRQFIGRTWCSAEVARGDGQSPRLVYNQNVYFHTSLKDEHILLIVEIVSSTGPPGGAGRPVTNGWGMFRLFNYQGDVLDAASRDSSPQQRHREQVSQVKRARYHRRYLTSQPKWFLHVVVDALLKPRLMRKTSCIIEKLSITLYPSVAEFEERLILHINDDRQNRANTPTDGSTITISERRLKVGVHNGWCYVDEPQILHLLPDSQLSRRGSVRQASLRHHNRSFSNGSGGAGGSSLVLRSKLQVKDLAEHPMFAVVITLEYILSFPLNPENQKRSERLGRVRLGGKKVERLVVRLKGEDLKRRWESWSRIASDRRLIPPELDMSQSAVSFALPPRSPVRHPGMHLDPSTPLRPGGTPAAGSHMQPFTSTPYHAATDRQRHVVPMEIQHVTESSTMQQDAAMSRDITELPFTPVHAPILVTGPTSGRSYGLSRAAYARLYSAGFPSLLDIKGEAPEVIDPTEVMTFDPRKEAGDLLQCNEIVLQFLAYSRMVTPPHVGARQHGAVFFTFQFYRFPQLTTERLLLGGPEVELSADPKSMPCILQRLDRDGSMLKGPPGYQVKYVVDPRYMKPGESALFVRHLAMQTLHIDVWDGDSLLLIGSCAVELKHLCRQGRVAAQVSHELDVVTTEHAEDADDPRGFTMTRGGGGVHPLGSHTALRGRLHLRLANIGHTVDTRTLAMGDINYVQQRIISSETPTKHATIMGTENSIGKKARVSQARSLVRVDRELATALAQRRDPGAVLKEVNNEGEAERQRKLTRMTVVRQMEGGEQPHPSLVARHEKVERSRDLHTVALYRQRTKQAGILGMLAASITVKYALYPSLGSVEFFEFMLRNPYNVEQTISIECDDENLSVITDTREWRHYKQLFDVHSPIEENMFNTAAGNPRCTHVFLRPKETVCIPFKYLSLHADHSVQPQGPVDSFRPRFAGDARQKNVQNSSVAKLRSAVYRFVNVVDVELHQLLRSWLVCLSCRPPVISKVFELQLPVGGGHGSNKVACGASPQVRRFFVCIYADAYTARPLQTWQLYVHALQRVDVSCVEGQTSRFSLVVRGTQAPRLVCAYSSHCDEMQLQPDKPFMLAANTVQEIHVGVRPLDTGTRFLFQDTRKIAYTNPYAERRAFHLLTSRSDLLQFRETRFELTAGETRALGLHFLPAPSPGGADVLVFVNDDADNNEETFSVRVTYA
ncbi:PREDICTED: nephrocystin-4-like, partial [Priapulus caudatus]|uniref:Nephrocystin-4-like n=1 Tax=Priapulus caudatus TaxID=37621 RepID=A0ABM1EVU0_PRICU